MKHQNFIILNGKHYDALTGTLLDQGRPSPTHSGSTPKAVDGFVRAPLKTPEHPKPAHQPEHNADHHPEHHAAHHAQAHHPEHAKTLMRRAVSRPHTEMKRAIRVQTAAEVAAPPASAIAPKRSAYKVDTRRLSLAKHTGQSIAIRHFMPYDPSVAELAVAPAEPLLTHAVPVLPLRPEPTKPAHHQPAPHHTPQHSQHSELFAHAIARATSHEQPHHKYVKHPRRRKLANTMAIIGAFLVIGGFITYLNMPNIELRVAAFQAGFGAQLPGYKPTGFALRDGVHREGSTVSLKFQSGNQHYTLTQQASSWDSQTLVENTLALAGEHKTVLAAGRTVYIYNDTNAVWVDGGVRYDLTGNAPLTTHDITALASSL